MGKTIISKKEQAAQRRLELKGLSNSLVTAAKNGLIPMEEDGTVNDLLKAHYSELGHKELKSFSQWKEEGYSVKKGEHALLLWAHPKPSRHSKEQATSEGKNEDEAKADYFPVVYLFSQKQVVKRK